MSEKINMDVVMDDNSFISLIADSVAYRVWFKKVFELQEYVLRVNFNEILHLKGKEWYLKIFRAAIIHFRKYLFFFGYYMNASSRVNKFKIGNRVYSQRVQPAKRVTNTTHREHLECT